LSWGGAVRRAREALGIKPYKGQFGDGWYWKLPEGARENVCRDGPETTCASSTELAHLRDSAPPSGPFGLPDAPAAIGAAHLRTNAEKNDGLWTRDGEAEQDAQDPENKAGEL
jgi:hypothetical protein